MGTSGAFLEEVPLPASTKKHTKKKSRTINVTLPADEFNEDDETDEPKSKAELELAEFIETLDGTQSYVAVYRFGRPGEAPSFEENISPEGLNEQVVKDQFGSGKFKLKFKGPDEKGRLVYKGQKIVSISAGRPNPNGNTNGGGGKQEDRFFELLTALIAAQKPAPPPPAFDMGGLAALLVAIRPDGPKQSDLPTLIDAMAKLKTATSPEDEFSKVTRVLELARMMNGQPADDDDSLTGVLKRTLSAFLPGSRGAQPVGGVTAPPEQIEEPAAALPANYSEEMFAQQLQMQINYLKSKALAGKNVQHTTEWILNNQEDYGAILETLKRGATFAHLLEFDPQIAQTPQLRLWFQPLYEGLTTGLRINQPSNWFAGNPANPPVDASGGNPGQPATGAATASVPPGGSPTN